MFCNQKYNTETTSYRGKAHICVDQYTILSTHLDQQPTLSTYNLHFMEKSHVMKYITTQPDEVRYITPATYK